MCHPEPVEGSLTLGERSEKRQNKRSLDYARDDRLGKQNAAERGGALPHHANLVALVGRSHRLKLELEVFFAEIEFDRLAFFAAFPDRFEPLGA